MVAVGALRSVLLTGCGWLAVGGDAVTATFSNELDQEAFLEITELTLDRGASEVPSSRSQPTAA